MFKETNEYFKKLSDKLDKITNAISSIDENTDLDDVLKQLNIDKEIEQNPMFDTKEDAEKYQNSGKEVIFIRSICKEIIKN